MYKRGRLRSLLRVEEAVVDSDVLTLERFAINMRAILIPSITPRNIRGFREFLATGEARQLPGISVVSAHLQG